MEVKYYVVHHGGVRFIRNPDHSSFSSEGRLFERANREKWFKGLTFTPVATITDADLVVFTGGADVTPTLYGEKPLRVTSFDTSRDLNDIFAFRLSEGKLRVGICRGAQFLNVMSGGKLWQHVNNHAIAGSHGVIRYGIGNEFHEYDVTSTHHQMMVPGEDGTLLGHSLVDQNWSSLAHSTEKQHGPAINGDYDLRILREDEIERGSYDKGVACDVEMMWYDKTRCLCVQGHPEYDDASVDFKVDFVRMINERIA